MAFSQLDWVALLAIGTMLSVPYVIEIIRMTLIQLPGDYYRDKAYYRVPLTSRLVWSSEWYNDMRIRAGNWMPKLWMFPFLWLGSWFLATAATWLVWANRANYTQTTWDAFLAMQVTVTILNVVWISSYMRSMQYIRMSVVVLCIFVIVLASLGIALYGSFNGPDVTGDGIVYLFYAVYWAWMTAMSLNTTLVYWKGGFDNVHFTPVFLHTTPGQKYTFPRSQKFSATDSEYNVTVDEE
jgi:tryptophan-rich sensory protein